MRIEITQFHAPTLDNVDIGYLNIGCLKIELFFQARLDACTKPIDAKTQAHDTGHLNHSIIC